MLKLCIVDDSTISQEYLRSVINKTWMDTPVNYTIKTFSDGNSFCEHLEINSVDVVILDIEIGDENGVDIAKTISKRYPSMIVVFVTSYEGYIRNAFGLNVFDYILKDEVDVHLPKTLTRIQYHLESKRNMVFKFDSGVVSIDVDECIYMEYEDRSVTFHLINDIVLIKQVSLTRVFEQCPKIIFIQPNSRYIINMNFIHEMRKGVVRIKGLDTPIEVARGGFKKQYQLYLDFLLERERL